MSTEPALPRATWWAHAYNLLNPVCWGIVTGVPAQLLLKDLHASNTIIGILLAIPAGVQLMQLVVAPHINRLGYRRFALLGWMPRILVVLLMAVLALALPWLQAVGVPELAVVVAILVLQLVFNVLRMATNAAFMPWYSALIPEAQRGRFLARDNAAGAAGGILVSLVTWALFAWNPPGVYAVLFAVAALCGVIAIDFISRLPDVPPPPVRPDTVGIGWRGVLDRPFIAQLAYNLLWTLALTGSGVCWVGVLRDVCQAPPSTTALMPMVGAWTALALLPIAGPVIDRTGNRPAMGVATLLTSIHLALWALLALGVLPFNWPILIVIQTFAACGGALFGLAAARLLMTIVQPDLRAQGFALHGMVCGIAGALFPIGWGVFFDLLVAQGISRGVGYGVVYILTAVLGFSGVILIRRLPDPGAHRMRDFVRHVAGDVHLLLRRGLAWRPR